MENSLESSQKWNYHMIQQFYSWIYIWKKENTNSKKYKHPNVHSSTIYNSQNIIYVYTHTHTHEYYSAIKKNEILPFATTWMDSEGITLSAMSDTERQILYDITYMWNLKIRQTSEYNKKETDSEIENKLVVTKWG